MSREGFSPKPRVFVSYPRDDGEEFATNLRKRYYLKSDREPKRAAFMALDSCGTLRVWDLESGQTLRTLQCHTDSVTAVALTPDTCRVVSGSHGNTLRVWDLEDVKEFVTFTVDRIVTACAVARDNRLIVAGDRFGQLHFLRLKEAVQTKPAPDDIKIQLLRRQQPTVKAEKPRGPFLPMLPAQTRAVFISYAHTDNQSPDPQKRWLDRFVEFLKPLVRQENATLCSDQDIKIGEEWHEHLQAHLNGAKAAVLLVSPAFLASNYIADSELPIIWRNAVDHGVRIFPILISPSLFERAKYKYPDPKTGPQEFTLSSLQAANPPSKTG